MSDEFPRRMCLDRMTMAEIAIYDAQLAVFQSGASPRLTEAAALLKRARMLVAEHDLSIRPLRPRDNGSKGSQLLDT